MLLSLVKNALLLNIYFVMKCLTFVKAVITLALFLIFFTPAKSFSQSEEKRKINLKDSTDGYFDLSDELIHAHGFIPIPMLITEPALGGIGGALGVVFMEPIKVRVDKEGKASPLWPSITGLGAGYTANNTWFAGAARMGEWEKPGIHYRVVGGYANVNIDMYKDLPNLGEKEFGLNMKTPAVYLMAQKRFLNFFSGGLQYMFSYMKVSADVNLDNLPDGNIKDKIKGDLEKDNYLSSLGFLLSFDNRDNVFSPSSGLKVDIETDWSNKNIGASYDYSKMIGSAYGYWHVFDPWVASMRLEWQQMFNNPPFYMLPYIDLRGVPTARYMDNITALAEMEHRVEIFHRWSLVGFAGLGKAFPDYDKFSQKDWVYNYGGGFRYLIARKFKLQMGMDFGFGPEDWGFYIVFGSAWLR